MSTNKNEFALLYKDKEQKQLFAYFCIYPNPLDTTGKSYIEHWAFVEDNAQDLYDQSFFVKSMNNPMMPTNRTQWIQTLGSVKIDFKGFMQRNSLLFEFKKDEANVSRSNEIFKDLYVHGDRVIHINLGAEKDWIIIQSTPVEISSKKYFQLALLNTLQQDNGKCFEEKISFSNFTKLDQNRSFKDFAINNGLEDIPSAQLPSHKVNYAIFSEVVTSNSKPTLQEVPEDSLLTIHTRATA